MIRDARQPSATECTKSNHKQETLFKRREGTEGAQAGSEGSEAGSESSEVESGSSEHRIDGQ